MTQPEFSLETRQALEAAGLDLSPLQPGETDEFMAQAEVQNAIRQQGWEQIRQVYAERPGINELVDSLRDSYHPYTLILDLEEVEESDNSPFAQWARGSGNPAAAAEYLLEQSKQGI